MKIRTRKKKKLMIRQKKKETKMKMTMTMRKQKHAREHAQTKDKNQPCQGHYHRICLIELKWEREKRREARAARKEKSWRRGLRKMKMEEAEIDEGEGKKLLQWQAVRNSSGPAERERMGS